MEFKQAVVTDRGRALMTKLLAGKITQFTKIAVSETKYNDNQLAGLTALSNIKAESPVSVSATNATNILATGGVNNVGLKVGYYVNTVGLYANDPDLGEILYSVVSAVDGKNSYIPPDTGVSQSGVTFKIQTEIAKADNVNMSVDPANVATQGDLSRMKKPFQAWANSADGKTDFTRVKPRENVLDNSEDISKFTPNPNITTTLKTVTMANGKQGTNIVSVGGNASTIVKNVRSVNYLKSRYPDNTDLTFSLYVENNGTSRVQISVNFNAVYVNPNFKGTVEVRYNTKSQSPFNLILATNATEDTLNLNMGQLKIEVGATATPFVSSKIDDRYRAFPLYTSFSNTDSNDYRDYAWVRSDEAMSIQYRAWANDENGTDFCRVYPKENLMLNTINPMKLTGKGGTNEATTDTGQFTYTGKTPTLYKVNDRTVLGQIVSLTATYVVANDMSDSGQATLQMYRYPEFKDYCVLKGAKKGTYTITQTVVLPADTTPDKDLAFRLRLDNVVGDVTLTKAKISKGGGAYFYTPAPSDEGVKPSDLIPKYKGIGGSQSEDYLDYLWDKSDQLRDYELQQIRTAITAMGGTL